MISTFSINLANTASNYNSMGVLVYCTEFLFISKEYCHEVKTHIRTYASH